MFDPLTVAVFCVSFLAIGYSLGVLQCHLLIKKA